MFQDIAIQDPVEILRSCYVREGSLRIVAQDLNAVIINSIPRFLERQGTETVKQGADDAGPFGEAIARALTHRVGQLTRIANLPKPKLVETKTSSEGAPRESPSVVH